MATKYPRQELRKFSDEELVFLGKIEIVRQVAWPHHPLDRVPQFRSMTDPGPHRNRSTLDGGYAGYEPLFFNKQTNIAMNASAVRDEETDERTVERMRRIVGLPPRGMAPLIDRLIYDNDPTPALKELSEGAEFPFT